MVKVSKVLKLKMLTDQLYWMLYSIHALPSVKSNQLLTRCLIYKSFCNHIKSTPCLIWTLLLTCLHYYFNRWCSLDTMIIRYYNHTSRCCWEFRSNLLTLSSLESCWLHWPLLWKLSGIRLALIIRILLLMIKRLMVRLSGNWFGTLPLSSLQFSVWSSGINRRTGIAKSNQS